MLPRDDDGMDGRPLLLADSTHSTNADEGAVQSRSTTTAARLTTLGIDRNLMNVINMTGSFLLIFTATNTTQGLVAALLGDLGTYSSGISYACLSFGGFLAPAICRKLGPKRGMLVGAFCYLVYVVSLIYIITPVIMVTSFIIGSGAVVLWTSQGMMMTASTTNSNKSKYNSFFYGTFSLSLLPGNIASHFLLADHGDGSGSPPSRSYNGTNPFDPIVRGFTPGQSTLMLALAVCAACGMASMLLLQPSDPTNGSKVTLDPRSVQAQVAGTLALCGSPKMACLLPLFIFAGTELTMWSTWFTRQVYKSQIGLVMVPFGLAEFGAGLCIGRFVEGYGRSPGLVIALTAGLAAMALTFRGNRKIRAFCGGIHPTAAPCKEFDDYADFYCAAALYGIMDCTVNSVSAAICSKSFEATNNTADAWALFRGFLGFGAAACFIASSHFVVPGQTYSDEQQLLTEMAIVAVSGAAAIFGHWLFCKYPQVALRDDGDDGDDAAATDADPRPRAHGASSRGAYPVHSDSMTLDGLVVVSACSAGPMTHPSTAVPAGQQASEPGPSEAEAEAVADAACEEVISILKAANSAADAVVRVVVRATTGGSAIAARRAYQRHFVHRHRGHPAPALSTAVVPMLPFAATVQFEVTATA